jgi:hypothetical protein
MLGFACGDMGNTQCPRAVSYLLLPSTSTVLLILGGLARRELRFVASVVNVLLLLLIKDLELLEGRTETTAAIYKSSNLQPGHDEMVTRTVLQHNSSIASLSLLQGRVIFIGS